jgi:nickel-dependent lactate racemase
MRNTCPVFKHEGGSIIMVCECREGLGSQEYCMLIREGHTVDAFMAHHCQPANFEIDQWCLQTTYHWQRRKTFMFIPLIWRKKRSKPLGLPK